VNVRNPWPVLPIVAGLASGPSTGCGTESGDTGADGSDVVVGMSDDVLSTDPASGYDPGSWLSFDNVFQSLLSFPEGATESQPDAAESCGFADADTTVRTPRSCSPR
jgi:peptide/nickel transport system substrate-binding protein